MLATPDLYNVYEVEMPCCIAFPGLALGLHPEPTFNRNAAECTCRDLCICSLYRMYILYCAVVGGPHLLGRCALHVLCTRLHSP
jgi:hypothetical protein